jgi:hypothetical protein
MKGLVDITDKVDEHPQHKRSCISMVWEVLEDLLKVVAIILACLHKRDQVGHRVDNLVFVRNETEIIQGATLIKVRLVDEVPTRLEAKGVLNVVSEGCTLSEGMIAFSVGQFWLRFLQNCKLIQSFL